LLLLLLLLLLLQSPTKFVKDNHLSKNKPLVKKTTVSQKHSFVKNQSFVQYNHCSKHILRETSLTCGGGGGGV
jgi:hypothetical protein